MQSFFSDPGGVGRDIALRSLRTDIVGLIGGPVKIHDTVFIDAPLADFFVTERNRDLYAIRWLDSEEFASGLTRTLSAYVRLHEAGRGELARMLDLPDDFPPATLVLVSDRMDDDWRRVVSTLRIPVMLLRAHSLVDGTRHSAGCLFEKCFAARSAPEEFPARGNQPGPGEPGKVAERPHARPDVSRSFPEVSGPASSPSAPREPQPDDRPVRPQATSAPQQLRSLAEVVEKDSGAENAETGEQDRGASLHAPAEPESKLPEEQDEMAFETPSSTEGGAGDSTAPEADAEPSADSDDPGRLLSDEEIATFRLLENVLESTRSR